MITGVEVLEIGMQAFAVGLIVGALFGVVARVITAFFH